MPTVTFTVDQVDAFKRSWPCHGLPEGLAVAFAMADNGDLVDIEATVNGQPADSADFDGPALLALSEDARAALAFMLGDWTDPAALVETAHSGALSVADMPRA